MKKSSLAVLMVAFVGFSAFAQESASAQAAAAPSVATEGKMLFAANGARLGAIYRVTADGSAQLIVDGKMVTVPANTLSVADGKLTTSLSKSEVRKLR